MEIEGSWRFHLTLVRMTKIKKSIVHKWGWGSRERRTLRHCWWDCKLAQEPRKSVWRILTKLQGNLHETAVPLLSKCPGLRILPYSYWLNNFSMPLSSQQLWKVKDIVASPPQPETCLLRFHCHPHCWRLLLCCSWAIHVVTLLLDPRIIWRESGPFPSFITTLWNSKIELWSVFCLSYIFFLRCLAPLLFQVSNMPFQTRTQTCEPLAGHNRT